MGPRNAFLTWLPGAVLLLVLASTQATTTPGDKDYLVMHRVSIIDPMGFGRPVEAASILLPKDWKVESKAWPGR